MSLRDLSQEQRDAMSIVDTFSTAVARGGLYSDNARKLAADYITSTAFSSDPEDEEIIAAFAKFLRQS